MIVSPAVQLSEPVSNCPVCGGAQLASRGCALCAFDAAHADVALDTCPNCGAGVTGLALTCAGCDTAAAEAVGRLLHAELLAEARRELPVVLAAFDVVPVLA